MNIELMSQLLNWFAANKYTAGIMMILMNVGTSFLVQDLMPIANRIFQHRWARRFVFLVIFFTATRDLMCSLVLTIVCTLLLDFFLNENSRYCMIPFGCRSIDSSMRRESFTSQQRSAPPRAQLSRKQRFLLNVHLLQRGSRKKK